MNQGGRERERERERGRERERERERERGRKREGGCRNTLTWKFLRHNDYLDFLRR